MKVTKLSNLIRWDPHSEGEIYPLTLDISETDEALLVKASLSGIRPEIDVIFRDHEK
jgi:hypothetical protein